MGQNNNIYTINGLSLHNIHIPEEILIYILSYVQPKQLLTYSTVCHKWNEIIKSFPVWSSIYNEFQQRPKGLPWYIYYTLLTSSYFTNLLLNTNGRNIMYTLIGTEAWDMEYDSNSKYTSIKSIYTFQKTHYIPLQCNGILQHILRCYKPHIYLSEWVRGEPSSNSTFKLECGFVVKSTKCIPKFAVEEYIDEKHGFDWKMVQLTVTDYPDDVCGIMFTHSGFNNGTKDGYTGLQFTGAVLKLVIDSIKQ